jgi:hypothetical protein
MTLGHITTEVATATYFRKFPANLRELQWWEERRVEDMPKYVRLDDKIYLVKTYGLYAGGTFYCKGVNDWSPLKSYPLKNTVPATLEEYTNFQSQGGEPRKMKEG